MDISWIQYLIAIAGGLLAGFVNTLAGSGSAITLTILTEVLGLPPNMANGSNRLGVFTGSAVGTATFIRHGKLDLGSSQWILIPTILGAISGVLVAVWVSNEQFKTVFQYLMVVMLIVILIKPKRWLQQTRPDLQTSLWVVIPVFFALGFYGGFIQMGMGVFFLAAMVLAGGYHILDANAVKAFVVAFYTLAGIAIFQYQGLINWQLGGVLAIGQAGGGWLAATYASRYKNAGIWTYRLLVLVIIAAVLRLFGVY